MIELALAAMTPPPPPPVKPPADQVVLCTMHSPDGAATDLRIGLRFEKTGDRDGYWWSIDGDSARYPSNATARNMYGYENMFGDTSGVFFRSGPHQYLYTLYYRSEEVFPSFEFVPDHLRVVRSPAYPASGETERVGIGFCKLERPGKEP